MNTRIIRTLVLATAVPVLSIDPHVAALAGPESARATRVPGILPPPVLRCVERAPGNLDPRTRRDAFDDPSGFIDCVEDVIAFGERRTVDFYVAISSDDYDGTPPCPWPADAVRYGFCPFGDSANDGRTRATPVDSFKVALELMHDDKALHPTADRHYTLHVRGGPFVYDEMLLVTANATYGGENFKGPYLYDALGQPVKVYETSKGGNNEWIDSTHSAYSSAGLGNATVVAADVTVKPYRDEIVTLDGGCQFVQPDGLFPGHPDWTSGDTVMDPVDGTCNADWPVNDDGEFVDSLGMVTVRRAFRVKIEGLHIVNSPHNGIKVFGRSSHVIVADNVVDNTYAEGIYPLGSSDLLVRGNELTRANAGSVNANLSLSYLENFAVFDNTIARGYNDAAIGGGVATSYGTVHDNTIYDNAATGIYINPGAGDGMAYVRYEANDIYDNVYSNCIRLASENEAPLSEILVRNNLCYRNLHGIWVGGYCQREKQGGCDTDGDGVVSEDEDPTPDTNDCCGEGVEMQDIFVVNNTVWGNGAQVWSDQDGDGANDTLVDAGYGFRANNPGGEDVYVVNNILAENWKQQIYIHEQVREDGDGSGDIDKYDPIDPEKLVLQYNIAYCNQLRDIIVDSDGDGVLDCLADNANEYPGPVIDPLVLQDDPDLVDPAAGDFHLCVGSPAIDAGVRRVFDSDLSPPIRGASAPADDFEDDRRDAHVDIGADEFAPGGAGC
jgi:hypothetical protein